MAKNISNKASEDESPLLSPFVLSIDAGESMLSDHHDVKESKTSRLLSSLAKTSKLTLYMSLVHSLLIIATLLLVKEHRIGSENRSSFSPAQQAIVYQTGTAFVGHDADSIYMKFPTQAQDHAWDTLIRPVYFNASKEELKVAGESIDDSVQVEGGGYLASTSVYHDLHCLRQIRLLIFRERYFPDITDAQKIYARHHIDHCLESLRRAIMCTGDTSLYTFHWKDPRAFKPEVKSNSLRKCIGWTQLEAWSRSRMLADNATLVRLDT